MLISKVFKKSDLKAQKKPANKKLAGVNFMLSDNYSATEIASTGQTSAQEPQSVQRSASIL